MENDLFNWVLEIPLTIAKFGNWLIQPINEQYLNISPLALLGVGGVATIIVIIGIHIVRLFL